MAAALHKVAAAADALKDKVANGKPPKIDINTDVPKPHLASTAHTGEKTPADEGLEFFAHPLKEGDAPIQVYDLPLEEDGGPNKDRVYIRLPPPVRPYVLRISLDAGTPPCKNGVLKTNFPLEGGVFGREKFQERKLPTDLSKPINIDLAISAPGAFVYWIEYDPPLFSGSASTRIKSREGYFNVDPILKIHPRSAIISPSRTPLSPSEGGGKLITNKTVNVPLDGLSVLTVVSKWMGPLSGWRPHLQEAMQRGYNMLHFTPLQQRGESRSPYSIEDQLAYDKELFEKEMTTVGGAMEVGEWLRIAREEYGLLSMTDVVLNHTANSTRWLWDHPEAGFSPSNSPHLAPALELDDAIMHLSASLAARSLPTKISTPTDASAILAALASDVQTLNLWQYYVLDVVAEKAGVRAALAGKESKVATWDGANVTGLSVVDLASHVRDAGKVENLHALSARFGTRVDSNYAASLVRAAFSELRTPDELAEAWGRVVDVLNVPLYAEWEEDTRVAMDNVRNRVQYTRLDPNGPKYGEISAKHPLVETYFTRLPQNEHTAGHDRSALSVANNGWIWNADPLQNFALPPSKAYLRREVIVWGDCVKLRYGSGPSDNPWLWAYMRAYVEQLAGSFDGFRIDNCHSTPLHVGTYFLDAARKTNPDLYVCAELFTGSEEMDVKFVSRLGINSLIRESMNGWDPKEMSRLLYRHGVGKPIGSMDAACLTSKEDLPNPVGKGPSLPGVITPLMGSAPHALLYDVTHDNESPLQKRSAEDALSTGALVTFALCATGSNKGFDDLYPKLLDLVGEERRYEVLNSYAERGVSGVKRVLNHLHQEMVLQGYSEGHVHQENDYIVMHRVQPATQKGYLLVAHTAFSKGSKDRGWIKPIQLRRQKVHFILGASLDIPSYDVVPSSTTLLGLPAKLVKLDPCVPREATDGEGPYSEITVPDHFPPGSIMLFETQMEGLNPLLEEVCKRGVEEAFEKLDLVELNVVLHRADGEERDATGGSGTYDVPGLGPLVFCGLEGWMSALRHVMKYNDLGHPLCAHLREGTWALDYVVNRLTSQQGTFPSLMTAALWFKERFDEIKTTVPSFLRPKYFAIVIFEGYKAARRAVIELSSDFVSSGHSFTQDLALVAVQMHGLVKSASLDPEKSVPSLAAGLPHFSASWARCWGRDVFISLRGLFLTTGMFPAAKRHILAFCSTLKHGLIPNLLDSVRNPRYNSRDSPWWMLQNIQDYVNSAPDGLALLSEPVLRRFPADDTWVAWNDPRAYAYSSTVAEIIQEILQRHANGIHFREYNAGPNLDMQMSDGGFNIDIYVDWRTGIIFGGNQHNCGTWMDKMGESSKAGNKGVPGTPRDGAPIEITGLLKSTLRWLDGLVSKAKFPYNGVETEINGKRRLVTYKEWNSLLQDSFEHSYYVPLDPADDVKYNVKTSIVNRRGIYKDVYGSGPGREWSDYQFRPNFAVAMTVAPELFDPEHALGALRLADDVLRGPLGMKTLDPIDSQYRGDYDNSNDSTDFAIAKGLNYHQGPEWMWPMGYFLRAYLYFDTKYGLGKKDMNVTLHHLSNSLLPARLHIRSDAWAGLPELTNSNGAFCRDACPTQAWSSSTLLDFLEDAHKMSREPSL